MHELAAAGQRKLAGLAGLDLVPLQWLHLTTFAPGFADQVPRQAVDIMVARARQILAETDPVAVSAGHSWQWQPIAEVRLGAG